MTSKKLPQLRGGRANISDKVLDELNAEGFPDFMVNAFLQTAETTNTIVSSRLPGGVGVDLMEANYDLKGFQIKAKSCDWGPMAGFICQLPFLNKAGYKKINYNTGYIISYLNSVEAFDKNKNTAVLKKIQASLNTVRDEFKTNEGRYVRSLSKEQKPEDLILALTQILDLEKIINKQKGDPLSDSEAANILQMCKREYFEPILNKFQAQGTPANNPDSTSGNSSKIVKSPAYRTYFKVKNEILKIYDEKISVLVIGYRAVEENNSAWSGENIIPSTPISPFIELKRKFKKSVDGTKIELAAEKYNCRDIESISGKVFGQAYNKSTPEESSIKVDFMLQQYKRDNELWGIYYSRIYYKSPGSIEFKEYNFSSLAREAQDDKNAKKTQSNREFLSAIGIAPEKDSTGKEATDAEKDKFYAKIFPYIGIILNQNDSLKVSIALNENSAEKTDYYPVCGFMNPHPPYKLGKDNFYKNAVSGDFDLFAFWPQQVIKDTNITEELLRLSERRLEQNLKLFLNQKQTFGLDFIPDFDEISQGGLKEDAETGNISNWGSLVTGMLNQLGDANYVDLYSEENKVEDKDKDRSNVLVTNKAFHSDEGGRPGVMEVEFPIAIFFPEQIKTRALNNEDKSKTPVMSREYIDTKGGLIKNVEELLQLIIDINFSPESSAKTEKYKIILHSEWLIHLFYASLLKEAKGQKAAPNEHKDFLTEGGIFIAGKSKKKLDEFKTIIDNHTKELTYGGRTFDSEGYTNNLKLILRGKKDANNKFMLLDDETFKKLRTRFLNLAFEKGKAYDRKKSVDAIWPISLS